VAYSWPYPGAMDRSLKVKLDWNVRPLAAALEHCKVLALDVDNRFLERYLAIYLTDHERPWTSTHPTLRALESVRPRPAKPVPEGADCVLTDRFSIPTPWRKVISMASDRRLLDYLQGGPATLEIGVTSPAGVEVIRAYEVEPYRGSNLRWTSAKTRFLVPNNPNAPTTAIELTAWPVAPGRHMTVTLNGQQVYNGLIPSDSVPLEWKVTDRSVDLIDIGIITDAIHVPADPRDLGVALRSLAVSR